MSSSQTLDDTQSSIAQEIWESAAYQAADHAERLAQLGVHKQLVNRLVEPFTWVDVIVSSTLWQNFFTLRCHPAAQPEMRDVAEAMREAWLFNENITRLNHGEWHIPLLTAEEQAQFDKPEDMWLAAAGRIARVSYETSAKKSFEEDIALAKRLLESGHWSPFEHIARCAQGKSTFCRNFVLDWDQFRAFME
jgi:thymidylate synthase ThyX